MKAIKLLLMDRHELGNPKIVTTEMFNEAIAELEELMKPKMCDTCKYLAKDKGWYCENFGFSCSSAGFEEHMPDDGYCCNRYENDN